MASPVSIGDAFLMAKLALILGRAFTTGRKSAPAEFREVESQLYSISTALSALGDACKNSSLMLGTNNQMSHNPLRGTRGNPGDDSLVLMLQGCQAILEHLKAVVDKYSCIDLDQPQQSSTPTLRRWTSELKKNWKKVWWTTEGGDLAALRHSLNIHLNCLNVALGVISHTQSNRIGNNIEHVTIMLTEIHTWFVNNIRGQANLSTLTSSLNSLSINVPPVINIRFPLFIKSPNGLNIICPNASVHPTWNAHKKNKDPPAGALHQPLFICSCSLQPGQAVPHPFQIDSLTLSPYSFAMRCTGADIKWMVYNAANRATNRTLNLIIKNIPASSIREFETNFIDILATRSATSLLRRDINTTLAYTTTGSSGVDEPRILNLLSDLEGTRGQVEKVTFTIDRQSYTRMGVESLQLLHYKASFREYLPLDSIIYSKDLVSLNTAELEITYTEAQANPDIAKSILYLTHKTVCQCPPGSHTVTLQNVDCAGMSPHSQESVVRGVDVSIQLATPKVAILLKKEIHEMRMELFVMSLKAPREDEKLALKIQAKGFHTEKVDIADSEISIVQSESTGRLRLIIVSSDEGTILSQELAEDFMKTPGGIPDFRSPTYVAQIVDPGTREIIVYNDGFQYVDFSDIHLQRLFGLGLAAFSGSEAPPAQISQSISNYEHDAYGQPYQTMN